MAVTNVIRTYQESGEYTYQTSAEDWQYLVEVDDLSDTCGTAATASYGGVVVPTPYVTNHPTIAGIYCTGVRVARRADTPNVFEVSASWGAKDTKEAEIQDKPAGTGVKWNVDLRIDTVTVTEPIDQDPVTAEPI